MRFCAVLHPRSGDRDLGPKKSEHQCFVFLVGRPSCNDRIGVLRPQEVFVSRIKLLFADCRSIAPIAHFDEQAFVTHAGQIAARNANIGQVFRPD